MKRELLVLIVFFSVCPGLPARAAEEGNVPKRNPFKVPMAERSLAEERVEQAVAGKKKAAKPETKKKSGEAAPRVLPLPALSLRGTLVGGAASMASINGSLLALGDEIKGYRLVAVREGEVDLYGEGRLITLTVAKQ